MSCRSGRTENGRQRRREAAEPGILPKSRRAQRYHDEIYHPRRQEYLKQIQAITFSILVWGPGKEPDRLLYKKRVEILNQLRAYGQDAFFSEEESPEMPEDDFPSAKAKEFVQGLAADLIVLLRCSYGSTAELHDFADCAELAGRMLVFLDRDTYGAYSTRGAAQELGEMHRAIRAFSHPYDLKSCKIAESVLYHVKLMQHLKYRMHRSREVWRD